MNKKLLATAIAGAMVFPTVASALDTKISGRVNRMIRFADNGEDSAVQFLDGSQASTRFRFNTSGDIGGGVTAGIIYEAGFLQSSRSSAVGLGKEKAGGNGGDGDGEGDLAINLRHAAVYFNGNFGRVDIGHTTEATDGIAYADLSGTGLGDEVAAGYADAVEFVDDNDDIIGQVSDSVATTGGGRRDLIKYETPSLGGFGVIRASMANDSRWGVAAFLGGAAGGGEWQLNLGYGDKGGESNGTDSDDEFYGGSAAFLFGQGTNIAVAYTISEPEEDDTGTEDFYVKLGHKWGNNAASISYGHSEYDDDAGAFEEGDRFGLAYVHTLPNSGINLYGGYHLYMADRDGDDPDDVNVVHVGALINFN